MTKRLVAVAIIVGIVLYLSKFLRPYFANNADVIFVLGFLPNFGLAFSLPFIYVSNRVRQNKPIRHFGIFCIVTVIVMILNEVRDKYQAGRVFDMLDVYASVIAVIVSYIVFRRILRLT